MSALLFLAEGFEETEALTTVDILRRAGVDVKTVSVGDGKTVASKNGISVFADCLFDANECAVADILILPGGGAVPKGYSGCAGFADALKLYAEKGGLIAAICIAPVFLAEIGILRGQTAVCYPSFCDVLRKNGVVVGENDVEVCGNFITSKGPGTTVKFALTVAEKLTSADVARTVAKDFLVDWGN